MLNLDEAKDVVKKNKPNSFIKASILYGEKYIFLVYPSENAINLLDPFYYVNRFTSEFSGYAINSSENPDHRVEQLFLKQLKGA